MLTRGQVAKRLRRSLATVRRLEGRELHPILGADGVHRFRSEEVERVARRERLPRTDPPPSDRGRSNVENWRRGLGARSPALSRSAWGSASRRVDRPAPPCRTERFADDAPYLDDRFAYDAPCLDDRFELDAPEPDSERFASREPSTDECREWERSPRAVQVTARAPVSPVVPERDSWDEERRRKAQLREQADAARARELQARRARDLRNTLRVQALTLVNSLEDAPDRVVREVLDDDTVAFIEYALSSDNDPDREDER